MPMYQYTCQNCNSSVEEIQKYGDPPPKVCEHCGAKGTLKKDLPRSNFALKGSCWASDGYS